MIWTSMLLCIYIGQFIEELATNKEKQFDYLKIVPPLSAIVICLIAILGMVLKKVKLMIFWALLAMTYEAYCIYITCNPIFIEKGLALKWSEILGIPMEHARVSALTLCIVMNVCRGLEMILTILVARQVRGYTNVVLGLDQKVNLVPDSNRAQCNWRQLQHNLITSKV